MVSYDALAEGIMNGDGSTVEAEVNKLINQGAEAGDILAKGLIGGMSVVSGRFAAGEMFLPELLMSANAMHKGLDIVKPLLVEGPKTKGRVVLGTVEGDIHDIGKKIVGLLVEGNGYEVIDLGIDVKAEAFAQAIEGYKPDILGMSALLTTTMLNMGKVIDFLKQRGLREKVKTVVGGAPVDHGFAESIGADGYAPEAASAVELVKKLVGN